MLDRVDLSLWYQRLGVSEGARALIEQIRSSEPARRVGGGHSNVHGRYPSRKMAKVIQFESHRVELAVALEMEDDDRVLEYYDQPCQIPLAYSASSGRTVSVMHTPDFFVLRTDAAGWEECKTVLELEKLAEKSPNRYYRTADGIWRCPPGEHHASSLGLYYRLRTSDQIDWVLQRNIHFLDDYVRSDVPPGDAGQRELIYASVCDTPGISLNDLLSRITGPAATDITYWMIARKELYVDLKVASLTNPAEIQVFRDQESVRRSFENKCHGGNNPLAEPAHITVTVGDSLQWDGTTWRVANLGKTMIGLISTDNAFSEIPLLAFERLVKDGSVVPVKIAGDQVDGSKLHARLAAASEDDLRTANRRFVALQAYWQSGGAQKVPGRTLRLWAARFRKAVQVYGDGYVGLLPEARRRGNRGDRLSEDARKLMLESIENDFESLKQKSKYAAWIAFKHKCELQEVVAPSYKTYRLAVRKRPHFQQTLKRKGRRAAYVYESVFWDLDLKTPRHGDRPFEIGHIDHTELDVELRCSTTDQILGRPWLTLLVDAFSRRILAMYLTFDPPSYRSCMMVLRNSVKRHGRLPQVIIVDGGREFESTYFETLLARYECTKKTRPPAKARFGSVCERLFGTTNTQFIHNLSGNTQIMRNVRQVTASVNPKNLAAWSLGELHERLSEYLFEIYDRMEHPALGQSPQDAFAKGLEMTGLRLQRIIRYDQDFMLCTMPSTIKGTAQICPGKGIKINHVYYWSDAFRDPELEQSRVAVRYDPFDAGTAYAFCHSQWVQCLSEYYSALHGRSEKEIMLATREIHKQRQRHGANRLNLNARMLAAFLESVEAQEVLLLQRARDRESAAMRSDQPQSPCKNPEDQGGLSQSCAPAVEFPTEIYGAL